MDAKQLQDLAERLLLGEYTTQDLYDAARCAAAWANVERQKGNGAALYVNSKTFTWFHDDNDFANGPTAIAAVEAAPEVKP